MIEKIDFEKKKRKKKESKEKEFVCLSSKKRR